MRYVLCLLAVGCFVAFEAGCSRTTSEPEAAVDPGDRAELARANNRFAVALYAQVRKEPGNLFLSPYSISTGLAMSYAGARGTTAEQMAKTLHFPFHSKRLHPAFAALRKELQGKQAKGYEIQSANALWLQQGFGLQAEFVEIAEKYYDGKVSEVDFVGGPEAARAAINEWVAKQTRDRIKALVQPDDLTPLTRLVLTNAIYFKGNWAAQFPKAATHNLPFYRKNGDSVKAPLMSQCATFRYWGDDTLQVAEFPYVGKRLAMMVVLPRSAECLSAIEKTLTPDQIAQWLSRLEERIINVYLPRFKAKLRLELTEPLSALGMPLVFDRDQADFTGMTGTDPQKRLHIAKVLHEAFVEVNEEGTEAAGATAVAHDKDKAAVGARHAQEPPTFRADHPFLFLIRNTRSGSIVFVGRLTDPSK